MMITVGMFTRSSAEWSKLTGIPRTTLEYRVRAHWATEDLFTKRKSVLPGHKLCPRCHTVQPLDNFYKRSDRDGVLAHCKNCVKSYAKNRYTKRT